MASARDSECVVTRVITARVKRKVCQTVASPVEMDSLDRESELRVAELKDADIFTGSVEDDRGLEMSTSEMEQV